MSEKWGKEVVFSKRRNRKKFLCLALVMLLLLTGCGSRTVTCDGCGAVIKVRENSNVTEEWIVFCKTCEEELMDDLVPAE